MGIRRVDPAEAAQLIQDGWVYVDVRSIPEFDQGHPTGAYNIPLLHMAGGARSSNSDFESVFTTAFPDRAARIVLGCRSGARSLDAATRLSAKGYTSLVDMRGGFAGERDQGGDLVCAGWAERGFSIAIEAEPGRSWHELRGERDA